jgi:hypothetical protein
MKRSVKNKTDWGRGESCFATDSKLRLKEFIPDFSVPNACFFVGEISLRLRSRLKNSQEFRNSNKAGSRIQIVKVNDPEV